MFCPSCGAALAQQLRYCNRCGAPLVAKDTESVKIIEKRMDSEMEGLFWITVFGVGLILGGMALLKKLAFSERLILAFMALSALAFITYYAIGVWQLRRLNRSLREGDADAPAQLEHFDTEELNLLEACTPLEAAPSVTENTTRQLEPLLKK